MSPSNSDHGEHQERAQRPLPAGLSSLRPIAAVARHTEHLCQNLHAWLSCTIPAPSPGRVSLAATPMCFVGTQAGRRRQPASARVMPSRPRRACACCFKTTINAPIMYGPARTPAGRVLARDPWCLCSFNRWASRRRSCCSRCRRRPVQRMRAPAPPTTSPSARSSEAFPSFRSIPAPSALHGTSVPF